MKLTKRNPRRQELLPAVLLSIFLVILLSLLLVLNMYPFAVTDRRELKAPVIEVTSEKSGLIFGSDSLEKPLLNDYEIHSDASDVITLKNLSEKDSEISMFFSSDIKAAIPEGSEKHDSLVAASGKITVTLSSEESVNVSLSSRSESEPFLPEIIVTNDGNTVSYITSSSDLLSALSDTSSTREVVLMNDITVEDENDIIVKKSCAVFVGEHSLIIPGRIIFDYTEEGTFQISGGEGTISASGFIANAPLSAVLIEYPFFDIPEEKLGYYVTARKYNSSRLRAVEYPVYSVEELTALASDEEYPKLFDTAEIIFQAPITLTDDIVFNHAVTLDINEELTVNDHTISVITGSSASITVKDSTSGVDYSSFIYDAPNCSLSWSGRTAPGPLYVAERMNLLTYGGKNLREIYGIGGYCMGTVESFVIRASDNPVSKEDIIFTAEGNVLTGYISDYSLDESELTNIDIAYKVKDCKLTFPAYMKNDDGTVDLTYEPVCTITDTYGNSKIFRIKLKRGGKEIPVVNIKIDGGVDVLAKEDYQNAVVSIEAIGRYGFDDLYDTEITIRGRGNSTWKNFDKKPLRLHFPQDISIFELPEGKDWILLANYTDKSLMRNRIANEIAKKLDNLPYAATQYCVDVFVNGSYQGVYTFGENLDVSPSRIALTDTGNADTGFLIEIGGVDNGVHVRNVDFFHAGLIKFALVKHPDELTRTTSQVLFIKNYFKDADKAVKKMSGYEEFIDIDSVIDWLILHELSNNTDSSFRRSCYFIKQPGEKLQMGPAWDFDIAFGNFIEDDPDYDTWACYTYHSPEETNVDTSKDYVGTTWGKYLLSDKAFVERFRARWLEVKDDIVSSALAEIDLTADDIIESANENFRVWKILNKRVTLQRRDVTKYNTFSKQVDYLKDFIVTRSEWMTSELDRMMAEFENAEPK